MRTNRDFNVYITLSFKAYLKIVDVSLGENKLRQRGLRIRKVHGQLPGRLNSQQGGQNTQGPVAFECALTASEYTSNTSAQPHVCMYVTDRLAANQCELYSAATPQHSP